MAKTTKFKAFCNRCNTKTNHSVITEHNYNDIEETKNDGVIQSHLIGSFSFQIIECNGCDIISYRSLVYLSNFLDVNETTGQLKVSKGKTFETFYPERIENLIIEKRIVGIPIVIRKAYKEVLECFNNDLRILCSAGLRAMIEGICNHFKIRSKDLKGKIDTLGANGLIGKELANSLQSHRLLGNNALHELWIAERDELKVAIELMEITMETLFGVPERHKELTKKISTRLTK